jgi:histidinol-phosphate aminotransferase
MSDPEGERPVHGAPDYAELAAVGLQPADICDFSVNSNPYGPSPHVREAISATSIERYPDRDCLQLRQALLIHELAPFEGSLSSLICGNGASELIWAIARAYLQPGLNAAIIGPTFGEYCAASRATGATISEFRAQADKQFQLNIAALGDWLQRERPQLAWLCNPNNPTGMYLSDPDVYHIVETCQRAGTVLVIDESYRHFVFSAVSTSSPELLRCARDGQIIIVRSLTKDFALAALRLGYALSSMQNIERLGGQMPSWNVNAFAQEAGVAAVSDRFYLKATLHRLANEREQFFSALMESGFPVIPSHTHFCLVDVGNGQKVRQKLLYRKMLVRDCASFGLPQYIRIATRPAAEWQQLLHALQEVV